MRFNKLNLGSVVRPARQAGREPHWSPGGSKVCEIALTGVAGAVATSTSLEVDHWLVMSASFLGNEIM